MALLYFEVEAKYDQLVKLRQEIAGLEAQLRNVKNKDAMQIDLLQEKLSSANGQLAKITQEAAMSGVVASRAFQQMEGTGTGVKSMLGGINTSLNGMNSVLGGLGTAVGAAFGVGAIGAFLNKVEQTRMYFQDIESSMKVFLGSAEKASGFTSDLKDYAYYNMYEFSELAGASKQMIAYGTNAKDVIGILDKLSNVAAGTGASLGEMVSLYNKAKSIGRVSARDAQSWAARGIVISDELKAMGKGGASQSASFQQLEMVLDKVTGKGGRYNGLMMEQMNNLSASSGQLQDNLTAMYEEIGEKLEPLIKGVIDAGSWMAENYQKVGEAILLLTSSVGVYRTILGISHALHVQENRDLKESIAALVGETTANEASAKAGDKKALAIENENTALREKLRLMKEEAELNKLNVLERFDEAKTAFEDAKGNLEGVSKQRGQLQKQYEMLQGKRDAYGALSQGDQNTFNSVERQFLDIMDKEKEAKEKVAQADAVLSGLTEELSVAEAAEATVTAAQTSQTNLLTLAKTRLMGALKGAAAFLTNPYVLATAAIVGLTFTIYKAVTAEAEEEKAIRQVNEAMEAFDSASKHRKETSNEYISAIQDETKALYEQYDAYNKLLELYPELKDKYSFEELKAKDVADINQEIRDIETNRQVAVIDKGVADAEKRIAELENQLKQAQMNVQQYTPGTNGYINAEATRQTLANTIAAERVKLAEWENKQMEMLDAKREAEWNNMSHEERNALLKREEQEAQSLQKRYNNVTAYFENLQLAEGMSNDKRQQLAKEHTESQLKTLDEEIAAIEARINNPKTSDEEKRVLRIRLTKLETLQGGLQDIITRLDLFARDPKNAIVLSLSFDKQKKKILGKEAADLANGAYEKIEAINNSKMSDEDKQNQILDIYGNDYSGLIGDLTNLYNSAADDVKPYAPAIIEFLEELKTNRNSALEMIATGISDAALGEGAKSVSDELQKIDLKQQEENKNYTTFRKNIESAQEDYEAAKAEFDAIEKLKTGGEEYDRKDYEIKKNNLQESKSNYETLLKEQNKYSKQTETLRQLDIQQQRRKLKDDNELRQSEINQMRDGAEKEIEQLKLNFKKQKDTIQQNYEDIREARMKEAEQTFNANPDKVGEFDKSAFLRDFRYTEQEDALRAAQDSENAMNLIRNLDNISKDYQTESQKRADERRKRESDILGIEQTIKLLEDSIAKAKEDGQQAVVIEGEKALENLRERLALAKEIAQNLALDQSQIDYYRQYGTASQKKQAITQDYEKRIRQAGGDVFAVRTLEKERSADIMKVDSEILSRQIDWGTALGELGKGMNDYLRSIYDKAVTYSSKDKFRDKPADEQQAFFEMLSDLKARIGVPLSDIDLKQVGADIQNYKDKIAAVTDAEDEVSRAQMAYNLVLADSSRTTEDVAVATINLRQAEDKLENAESERTAAEIKAKTSAEMTVASLNRFGDAISKIAGGSLKGLYEGGTEALQSFGLKDFAVGPITSAILGLVDLIADKGISGIISGITDTLIKLIDTLFSDILNGGFLNTLVSGLGGIVGGLADGVSRLFGGDGIEGTIFGDILGNAREFEKLQEETEKLIAAFDTAISYLNEDFAEQVGAEAIATAGKLEDYYRRMLEATRTEASAWGHMWEAGSHSYGYRWWNDELDNQDRKMLRGAGVNGLDDLFEKSGEELKDLQTRFPDIFMKMSDDARNYLNQIIEIEDEIANIPENLNEKLTGMSFDDFKSAFLDTALDLQATAYDTADNISEYFFKAIMSSLVEEKYKDRIEKLYTDFSAARESGDTTKIAELKKEWNAINAAIIDERNSVAELTGYTEAYKQQASSKGFQAMSQETGSELNGRFTALQYAGESVNALLQAHVPLMSASLQMLASDIGGSPDNPIGNMVSDIQNTLSRSYLELREISEHTGFMHTQFERDGYIRGLLERIKANTDKLR